MATKKQTTTEDLKNILEDISGSIPGYSKAKETIAEISKPMNLDEYLEAIVESLKLALKSPVWLEFHKATIEILGEKRPVDVSKNFKGKKRDNEEK